MSRPRRNFYRNGRPAPAHFDGFDQANAYALAHQRNERAAVAEANTLSLEALHDLALERGLTDARIVPSHGRLMATGHGAAFPSEIVSEADVDRLIACRRPMSCPIDGVQASREQGA